MGRNVHSHVVCEHTDKALILLKQHIIKNWCHWQIMRLSLQWTITFELTLDFSCISSLSHITKTSAVAARRCLINEKSCKMQCKYRWWHHLDIADFEGDWQGPQNYSSVKLNIGEIELFLGGHISGVASFMKFCYASVPKILLKKFVMSCLHWWAEVLGQRKKKSFDLYFFLQYLPHDKLICSFTL